MIKLYPFLHNAISPFKKQFLSAGLLLFLTLHMYTQADAQCTVNAVANQTVCNNTATAAINFTGTATSYNWINTTTSIGLAASGTGNIASFTAVNATAVPVTATITVTPVSGACTGTPINFTITVNPSPPVAVTPAVSCGGVSNGPCDPLTASGADSYVWSPISGLYADCAMAVPYTGGNVSTVFAAPGFYFVNYTVTGTATATGCYQSAIAQVNYTPPAPVVWPTAVAMCLGDPPVKLSLTAPQFCSGPVNIAVPDNNPAGASSTIVVSGIPASCPVTGIFVRINMTHTRIGDMVFVLKAPNGNVFNLDYRIGATGTSTVSTGFANTTFSSVGTVALSTGTNPYTGTFKADAQVTSAGGLGAPGPTGILPTINNWSGLMIVPNGGWTLGFYDAATSETGTLNSWCLGFTYSCGASVAATPAVWSPLAGLYIDPAATIPYNGIPTDSVWTKPSPAGVYTYQVTHQGLPAPLCTPVTNFVNTNGNATVTFNLKNNHPFPIKLTQIDSRTLTAGIANVSAYYYPVAINGAPGAITAANGWQQFGSAYIVGTASGIQQFITGLSLVIPPGSTYGICIQATTPAGAANLAYSMLSPGNYSFNDGGCEIVTGTNIGYSGANIPAAPLTTPSGFIGIVHFSSAVPSCTSPPTSVVVTVGVPTNITAQPVNQSVCTDKIAIFTVGATGALSYQWQVTTNGGVTYTNIINGGVYSGATTATLTITAPPLSMSGYRYRVIVNGSATCAAAVSVSATLTVNPLPQVSIYAHPYRKLLPGLITTLSSIVSPNPAATYTWLHDGSVVPGATADSLLVDFSGLGLYQLSVTDINGCTNLSDTMSIRDSLHGKMFVYPNPASGRFQVRMYSAQNAVLARTLIVYDNMGKIVFTKNYTQTISYQSIDVDVRARGKGLYWVEVMDEKGKRVALSKVIIQ